MATADGTTLHKNICIIFLYNKMHSVLLSVSGDVWAVGHISYSLHMQFIFIYYIYRHNTKCAQHTFLFLTSECDILNVRTCRLPEICHLSSSLCLALCHVLFLLFNLWYRSTKKSCFCFRRLLLLLLGPLCVSDTVTSVSRISIKG